MRILFAAADRDLLRCYGLILGETLGETVTAFDGTQVLTLTAEETFDIVVLDQHIPRMDYRQIVQRFNQSGLPVIVLLDEPENTRLLLEDILANAYLPLPFQPEELKRIITDVAAKKSSGERIAFGDQKAAVADFRLTDGPRLTAAELDILGMLAAGERVDAARMGVYIGALNGKLAKQNSRSRIRYRAGEGYQLVTQDE